MPVVLRAPGHQRAAGVVGFGMFAAILAGYAVAHLTPVGVAAGLGAVLSTAVAVRWTRLRIEVHPDRLVLVNWLRTVDLPWAEVARIRYDHLAGGLVVRLVDGRELGAACFATTSRALPFTREAGRSAALRLEQIRRRR